MLKRRAARAVSRVERGMRAVGWGLRVGWAALLLSAGCSLLAPKYTRPVITVAGVELQGGNLFQQKFRVTLHVQNPNDRSLPVNGVQAELRVDGDLIASGVTSRAFVVPALGDTDFDLGVTANAAAVILKLAAQRDRSGAIDYEVSGSATVDLPWVHDLPFHEHGSFPLQGLR